MLTTRVQPQAHSEGGSPRPVIITALLLAAALTTSIWQGLLALSADGEIVLGCLRLVFVCLGALRLISGATSSGGVRAWSLGPTLVATHAVLFGVTSLAWRQTQSGTASLIAVESVVRALDLMCVAVLAFAIGYCLGAPKRAMAWTALRVKQAFGARWEGQSGQPFVPGLAPWWLFLLGALGVALQIRAGYFGYVGDPTSQARVQSGQMLTLLVSCGLFAVVAAALRWIARPSMSTRLILAFMTLTNVAVGLFSGLKENAVLPFLAIALVLSYGAGRTASTKAVTVLLLGALVFLLVAVPLVTAYRQEVRRLGVALTPAQALESLPRVAGAVFSGSVDSGTGDSLKRGSYRLRAIDSVAIVVQRSPDAVPYRDLSEVVVLPVSSLIPRAIWPDKPIFDSGLKFNQDYFDLPPGVLSSASIPIEADLYRRGGLLVMAAGMLFVGCLCRLLDATLSPRAAPHAIFAFISLLILFVKDEAGLVNSFASLPIYLVTGLVLSRLVFREPPRPGARTGPHLHRPIVGSRRAAVQSG